MNDPWDRQPGETSKAFQAFLVYRDAAPRHIAHVARTLSRSTAWIHHWQSRWDWMNRAAEFDSYLARQRLARREKRLAAVEDKAIAIMDDAIERAIQRLKSMDPEEIPAGQVVRMIKDAVETQLKVLGHQDAARVRVDGKIEVDHSGDAAWVEDYVRQLRERSGETPEPGNAHA